MKNVKITRRSFLLGLGAASSALLLSTCGSTDAPASSASTSALPQPDSGLRLRPLPARSRWNPSCVWTSSPSPTAARPASR